jgi:hypothetical protein
MRCTQPTTEVTGRQATCPSATNTSSVGFGKRTWQVASTVDAAATLGESGYPHP